jgi:hypothetical protein
MKRMTLVVLGALLGLALAACSGGGDAGSTTAKLTTVRAVYDQRQAEGTGCQNLTMASDHAGGQNQLYTREDGSCEMGEESLNIVTFDGSANRDRFLEAAKQFGGIYVIGDTWAVGTESQTIANKVRDALGGEIR